ncbi:MAG: hypothetical protein ACLQBB_16620 [Solirubrobacteraceae bacterium]
MSAIYRQAQDGSTDFQTGSFGTIHANHVEFLAQIEAGSPAVPRGRLYVAEVTFGDEELSEYTIEDFLLLMEDKPAGEALPMLRDFLLSEARRERRPWMQVTAPNEPRLDGALVYVGQTRVPALPLPEY